MTDDYFDIELPPTLRVTHEDMKDPGIAAEVEEFRQAHPEAEVIISDDATCPHCAAQGIRVEEDGSIRDAVTGELRSGSPGVYVTTFPRPADPRRRRKAARKAQRSSRRKNR